MKDYWKAIDVLFPKHKMAKYWHDIYKNTTAYCSDEMPNGWGNFGCKRCDAIVQIEKRSHKKIYPRS